MALSARAQAEHGCFYLALAGGSTPQALYRLLASDEYREQVDWSRVEVFFGDERYVGPDHPDSNYRMARETMLAHLPIPPGQIHPLDTQQEVRHAAAAYARLLQQRLPQNEQGPVFDLVLLGMGDDGHTASLFPRTCILHDERLAAAVYVEKFKAWRLSLTYRTLNNAGQVWLLVAGANKAAVIGELQAGRGEGYPVAALRPQGELNWFVDRAALGGGAAP